MLLFSGVVLLGAAACSTTQEKAVPPQETAQPAPPLRNAPDWRARMQQNHNADSSVAQTVRRLTRDLELTADQQAKVRQLAQQHNVRIQAILDTAPPTLTYQDFQTQVHAISGDFHNAVNAILTPHQLDLLKAMLGRPDSGRAARRAP
jgi:hypothetical protein